MRPRLQSLLVCVFGRALPGGKTDQYLKARHALLRVEDAASSNFFGLRLDSLTHIDAFGIQFRLRVKRIAHHVLQLTLDDVPSKQTLLDMTATVTDDASSINLQSGSVRLIVSLDAMPKNNRRGEPPAEKTIPA